MAQQQGTYVNYSVAGNQINDTFNIVVNDLNNTDIIAIANVYPESDSPSLKKAVVIFMNSAQAINVSLSIPARLGLVEVLDDHPDFDLLFGFEPLGLEAKSISVEVQAIERNDIYITHIKGTFNGIAVYKDTVNGDEVEESYIVNGDFEYNAPQ